MKILFLIILTFLLFNQFVIILEKEKLEKRILLIFKIINGKPLTIREKNYVRKYR